MKKNKILLALSCLTVGLSTLTACNQHTHTYEEHAAVAATCETAGNAKYFTCSAESCKDKFFDADKKETTWDKIEIPALGHNLTVVSGQKETCTEVGYKDAYKCSRCNTYYEDKDAKTKIGDEAAYTTWKTTEGKGKISPHDHTYVYKEESLPTRDIDGLYEHYECSECHGYFDSSKNPTTYDALVKTKKELVKFEFDETFAEVDKGVDLPDISITETLIVDVKLADPTSKPARIDFAVGEDWNYYAGRFEITKSTEGVYSTVSQYAGVSIGTTEDGYCRVYINLPKVTKGQDISKITKFNLMMVKCADGTDYERVKGEIRVSPSLEIANADVKRGYTLDCSSWVYLMDEKWSHTLTEKIYIDFKFEEGNTQNLDLVLYDGWDNHSKHFEIQPDGTILWQKPGAQVIKVADQDGFVGGYCRLIIDLSYHASWTDTGTLTKVNRIAIKNNGCKVTVDVDPINCLVNDPWYTLKGSTEADTKIDLYTYNTVAIRDGSGNLYDKNLYFEVSGEGGDPKSEYGSEVKFALMDGDSKNASSVVLYFKSSVLVSAKFWGGGGGNAFGTITDLGDNKYSVTIDLAKLPGGDIATSSKINYYNGAGIIKNGVTSFSFNLDSFKLVDKTA